MQPIYWETPKTWFVITGKYTAIFPTQNFGIALLQTSDHPIHGHVVKIRWL